MYRPANIINILKKYFRMPTFKECLKMITHSTAFLLLLAFFIKLSNIPLAHDISLILIVLALVHDVVIVMVYFLHEVTSLYKSFRERRTAERENIVKSGKAKRGEDTFEITTKNLCKKSGLIVGALISSSSIFHVHDKIRIFLDNKWHKAEVIWSKEGLAGVEFSVD